VNKLAILIGTGALVASTLLFFRGCDSSESPANASAIGVYYVPIGAETLVAITSESIEQRGRRCEIPAAKDIRAIRKVLNSATDPTSEKFSNKLVRAKLFEISAMGSKLIAVVENNGLAKFPTGQERLISTKGMETLKKVIERQCE
jgi:hypothetical protein